ncbi:MAG TPA: Ig domain-containing protein, partial [Actinomycetota bacterium]|nr:Ig domain-containing protein [Actinomycetota bacterium]
NLSYTDTAPLPAGMAGVESWDDGAGWAIDHFSAGNLSAAPSAPVFTAASPSTSATVGLAYSYAFAASGSPAPSFSLGTGSLPPGLSLSSAGVLSGTPTTAGSSVFDVAASNPGGTALSPTYTLVVSTAATAPAFTADSPPPSATTGMAYSYTFAASGSPAPSFAVATGSLPPGLTLSAGGVLSGTPTTTGTFGFSVSASNSAGTVTSASLTVAVSTGTSAPAFTAASPPPTATTGVVYSYSFSASGSPAPVFAVATGSLPPGLGLASTGLLSGTPTADGTFTFSVSAANSVGTAFTAPFSIAVAAAPSFPIAAGTIVALDTFTRGSVTNGWGTASDGHLWGLQSGAASVLSVAGNQGRVQGSNSMATARVTLGSATSLNAEAVDRYTSGDYANDCGHLLLRYSSATSFYVAGLDSPVSGAEINVMKMSGGTEARVASVAFPAVNGTAYWQRVRVTNSGSTATIQVRVWKDGTAEPSTWNLSYTDTAALPAGTAGIESWDDGLGWAIDHFSAGSLP